MEDKEKHRVRRFHRSRFASQDPEPDVPPPITALNHEPLTAVTDENEPKEEVKAPNYTYNEPINESSITEHNNKMNSDSSLKVKSYAGAVSSGKAAPLEDAPIITIEDKANETLDSSDSTKSKELGTEDEVGKDNSSALAEWFSRFTRTSSNDGSKEDMRLENSPNPNFNPESSLELESKLEMEPANETKVELDPESGAGTGTETGKDYSTEMGLVKDSDYHPPALTTEYSPSPLIKAEPDPIIVTDKVDSKLEPGYDSIGKIEPNPDYNIKPSPEQSPKVECIVKDHSELPPPDEAPAITRNLSPKPNPPIDLDVEPVKDENAFPKDHYLETVDGKEPTKVFTTTVVAQSSDEQPSGEKVLSNTNYSQFPIDDDQHSVSSDGKFVTIPINEGSPRSVPPPTLETKTVRWTASEVIPAPIVTSPGATSSPPPCTTTKPTPIVITQSPDYSGNGQIDIEAQHPVDKRRKKAKRISASFRIGFAVVLFVLLLVLLLSFATVFL